MFPDAKSTQEIISKIRELQELGDMSKDELDELYSIFSDSNDSNIKDNIEKLVKNKKELENKMKEIDGLLPKSKGQEDVVTKLKREKKRKEDLKKLLDNIINLLPHCSTEQEIERSLSEILEFLKSLYHLIYIQNKDQLKLISKYNIENESDLNLENIRYEHIIDDLQQFFKEYKRNMNILSDLDKLLPKNKDPNLMNRLNKELQKKKQQEDLLKEIENTLPQRNQSNVPLITRLKNELNLSNDLQDIINKIHSILPQYKENTNHFTNTEDEYESDNESIEDKNEFNRSIIPKVQQEIDMKNSFQKKILEIENLLPKSKDDNLSNRLKKELDKKEQLQKQLDDLSSRFDHCKTFDDLSSHISELLRNNSNLKNILYQIDGLFSEVQNKVINDYDEEDEKEKDDFSYLIQIIGQYIDNTNSLKRKLEEIESLLPKYKNQGDLVSRLKDEFNKKEKVQQLAGKLQNIIPGVKTPEELAKKVQKILQEKEIQKTIIEQLNDILPELSENRTSNYDEEEDDNQMIEIGHNLPKRSQDIMNKYNQMKTLLDAINNLLPQNNKNDLITKLKKELKNKDRVQQQMEKLNNLLDSTSGNGADLSSKLKDLIQENEEMKQQLDELDSTLPQTNEDDDLLTRIKKLIKSKENQDSLVTEIESTLPKSNNQLGIVSRIKNELKQKEKLQQQLDSLKSILNTPNNSDIINQYKEMAQDNSDMRRILDEANGLLSSHDEDIIPKIEKLLKQKEEQAQTIEDIEGILPKSKTKDSIVKRIQKELQKKDELHKQLESMKSVLPGNKLSGDISDYLKQLLDENNLLKQLNEEINDILPSGDEEMLAKIQNMTQENENLKKQVSEIDSLVPGSPSRENIVDKLKKEFKKNQKTQQNLNSLMSLLPEVSTPEELYVALQNIMTDNNIMKRDLENIGSIFAEGDEDLHSKVQSLMKENDGLNHLVNEIDSLVPKQKGKQGIIDRLKSEFKSKEKLQKKLEEMNDLMNSSKTSLNDPMSSLQSLLEENSNQRELLETISSILPTKEGIEENDIISQSQFAVDEISRLNGIIEDIERLLPTSKTNDNLISRLKKELEHKTKFEKGIENIQELLPTCKNINDLPTTISNLLELKELFKHYVSDIVSIVNQSNNNQRESEKEYETENEISDDYPENEGKEFLNELEKLMNEFEEMKTERRQIEELLPKINNKNKESLLTRLKQEFDKNKKNEEELQQLYSHFSNNDNISHILEEISQYRHEIEELTNMFESELSPQHNYSDYENDSVIELAKKVIDDKKENDKIISTLEKIIPMKDKKGDIVVNAKKLVDEYDNLMKHVNKIMKILPKSNSFDDITKSIQEIMDEKNELNNKMNQYQTIFPISNSLDDLENLHINENGVVEDIPTRLKRLIKEKKEVCELLGVPDDIKAAIDVLLDENKTLKKENGELYLIINQLKELFEVKSHSELVDAAIHQRETIESTSDLFVKLLEILAGPMNTSITLRLPISPQIKEKLWKILTEMKQKMNDTDEKIIHILTKAKRAGYEGIDPCDAVKFLEETATLYEQQRVNEFFHGQVSSIRELMNEQHKTYESTKNKYNRQAKEQKEMLLEMQEKFALREEEMMQECEDVNNQMIALKEELEKANKLKTEILRLACGQAADMEYLRSNMSRTENSLLKNAEKMRTIVAQVQARSANKKKSTKVQKKPQVEHLSVQPEKPTQ
ncbi:hypothetical protein TRFO_05684 [Tritrichomonas foetus]|uniref:Uncharacterized protein n=1 Tax=Tritrichomonas foetus TaxID=1144522 RepID=A0A1J4K4C4_9EUKA|nr:hypothetical protein TRFO_05684 [Tritrichomonas foetus]|eukprot:OHT06043.1 hypothetical protein TRFO_05684 [Tritrichomonas foetus]